MFKHIFLLILLSIFSFPVNAAFNAEHLSVIKSVEISIDTDSIYIRLESPPTDALCDNTFLVIDGGVSYQRRQMLLSRLLTAYATKEKIKFGYDKSNVCLEGFVRTHRVG